MPTPRQRPWFSFCAAKHKLSRANIGQVLIRRWKMAQGILVLIEQRQGQIRKSSLEALSEARRLAQTLGATASALIIGSNIKNLVGELSHYKPNNILIADNNVFTNYSTEGYAKAAEE